MIKVSQTVVKKIGSVASYADKPAIIVVGLDQSLRFIPIDITQSNASNSKLLPVTYVIKDGYHRIKQLLSDTSNNSDVAFKEGLALLQVQADNQTLDLVKKLLDDSDTLTANQALQLVQWVATTSLDKTAHVLEQQLSSAHSAMLPSWHFMHWQTEPTLPPVRLDT